MGGNYPRSAPQSKNSGRDNNDLECNILFAVLKTMERLDVSFLPPLLVSERPVASVKKKWNGKKCAMKLHSNSCFGLTMSDYLKLYGKNSINWTPSSVSTISCNTICVKKRWLALKGRIRRMVRISRWQG